MAGMRHGLELSRALPWWAGLLFCLWFAVPLSYGATAPGPIDEDAVAELLRSAHLWQALERPDAEREVLHKLLAVQPDSPRALFLLGELELRAGHIEQARRVQALLAKSPQGAGPARELADMLRIYTVERERLSRLRLYVRANNWPKALTLARALFPTGRPPGDLANEFAVLLASTPGGWQTMRELLEERISAYPNPKDRLTLFEVLALHEETRDEALEGFAELARGHDVDPQRIASAWRHALLALKNDEEGLAQRRRFLARYPTNEEVRAEVEKIESEQLASHEAQNNPALPLRLAAEQSMQAGELADAEAKLQQALDLKPEDPETIGTLGLLRLRQGNSAEALRLFEKASDLEREEPALRARWLDLAQTARYWSALAQARELRDAGDLEGAVRLVESVRHLQPEQREAEYLLASLLVAQKKDREAEQLYRELLARDPADARAWRGLLSLWLQQGKVELALDKASELPQKFNVSASDVLDPTVLRDAISLATEPHPDAQLRLLERAVALVPTDPWLRYDLARLYLRLGLPRLAQEVMEEGERQAPEKSEMHYAAALIASASGRDAQALATVEAIPQEQQTSGMRELGQRLRFETALTHAHEARAQGDTQADALWRNEALRQADEDPGRLLRVARADVAAEDDAGARLLIERLLRQEQTLSPEQLASLADVMIDAGQIPSALVLVQTTLARPSLTAKERSELLLARARAHHAQNDTAALHEDFTALHEALPQEDVELHIQALALMDKDRALEHEWMAELLRSHGDDPRVQLEAARQAERDRNYASAVGYLRELSSARPNPAAAPNAPIPQLGPELSAATSLGIAPAAGPPEDSVQAKAQRELAEIQARRQGQVDVGWMRYWRAATDGLSTLRGTEIPLVAVYPSGYDGNWFVQVDRVDANAGTLPGPIAYSSQFGKVLALSPAGLAQSVSETAQGASFAAGWRGDERRFDLGVVGVGFPVTNVVGGFRQSATLRGTDVSAEVSRRVITASLLSYAGANDPITNEAWGGVTNTAVTLRASRALPHRWTLSASLTAGEVTGRNVLNNPNVELRGAITRDWIRKPDFELSAGASVSAWHYVYNQDFYTFGHGGYYSPQQYVSLGLPIEAQGRRGALSYDVRVTGSWSATYLDTAPYYPTNSTLQALAGNPVYTSGTGSGGGPAGSLYAAVEYRSTPHWSVGAWLDIDRSAYYAPNQVMAYVRYWFEPQTTPVVFGPRRVLPISQY